MAPTESPHRSQCITKWQSRQSPSVISIHLSPTAPCHHAREAGWGERGRWMGWGQGGAGAEAGGAEREEEGGEEGMKEERPGRERQPKGGRRERWAGPGDRGGHGGEGETGAWGRPMGRQEEREAESGGWPLCSSALSVPQPCPHAVSLCKVHVKGWEGTPGRRSFSMVLAVSGPQGGSLDKGEGENGEPLSPSSLGPHEALAMSLAGRPATPASPLQVRPALLVLV